MNYSKSGTKSTKKQTKVNTKPMVIDCGVRKIVGQNFSKLVSLPKTALENLGKDIKQVNVELVQENNSKYIKLVPITGERETK
jgi:hypothetical protein